MHKKWLFSGLVAIFLAANLFYWLPVMADPSVCLEGFKCFFNDEGSLFFKSSSSTSDFLYLNYIGDNAYGLGVSATGELYHDGAPVVVADGGTYGLNVSGESAALSMITGELKPTEIRKNNQSFVVSSDQAYWDSSLEATAVNGLSSVYSRDDSVTGLIMVGQLAFIREGDQSSSNQYLQFRLNDPTTPERWGVWREVCDNSNNCHNFINFLDNTASSSLVMYGDPNLLVDSGLKIGSADLANCGSLNTVGGVIGCGAAGSGGGVAGSGTINYLPKWSNTSTLANSLIYDNGTNVGIGDSSPSNKLSVNGTVSATTLKSNVINCSNGLKTDPTGTITCNTNPFLTTDQYWTGTATNLVSSTARASLGLGSLATLSAVSGGTAGTISDGTITNADINASAAIAASKIQYGTYFINSAGTSGQVWTSDGNGPGNWAALAAGAMYTAGSGLNLSGNTFSLAASGTSNYLTKWTGTNTLGQGIIYDNGTNVGIGTTTPDAKLNIYAGDGNGLKINGFGSGNFYGIDLTNSGLSGSSDYLLYAASNMYIRADGYMAFPYLYASGYLRTPTLYHTAAMTIYTNSGSITLGNASTTHVILNPGSNIGIGTTSPAYKLAVAGDAYFSSPITVQTPTLPGHAVNRSYIDGLEFDWTKLMNYPAACSSGQFISAVGDTITCQTPAGTAYTAGNGLNLSSNAFSLAASGSANYVTRWTSTNQLGYGKIFDNNTSVGINTASPSSANLQINAANNFEALRLVSASAYSPLNIRNNANNADIFRVDQTGSLAVGSIPWARLTSFPTTACGTNQFVTGFNASGDFNCATPSTSSHDLVTLASIGSTSNAQGASLSGQVLTLQPASASFGGIVTTGTQTFAGSKTFNSQIIGNISGNAATANELSANGDNCSAGYYPLGVDEKGKAEDCTPITGGGTYTADGNGLELSGNIFGLELNGTTLSRSVAGLKVNSISTTEIANSTIVDADISSSASIAWNKISKAGSSLTDLATRDHSLLNNLANDDHPQYVLSAGRATSQLIKGSTAANGKLQIQATSHGTVTQTSEAIQFFVNSWGADQAMTILHNGNIGISKTNPAYKLDVGGDINLSGTLRVNGTAFSGSNWTVSGNNLYSNNSGNVGIGTSSPGNKLTVAGSISFDNGNITSNGSGEMFIQKIFDRDNNAYFIDPAAPYGNSINVLKDIETAGNFKLGVSGKQYLGYSTDSAATPSFSWFADTNTGLFRKTADTIALTTGGSEKFSINSSGRAVFTDGSNNLMIIDPSGTVTIGDGNAPSKLNVGTVDPIYTIGGKKYSTYMAGMTGVKEETSGALVLNKQSAGLFMAKLDFQNAPQGSDIWLFGRTTNLINNQGHFDQTSCLLTPNFAGQAWYEKDWDGRSINIFARPDNANRASIEVSYRLTAPRFDSKQWTNYNNDEYSGFNLDELLK